MSPALAGRFFTIEPPQKPRLLFFKLINLFWGARGIFVAVGRLLSSYGMLDLNSLTRD